MSRREFIEERRGLIALARRGIWAGARFNSADYCDRRWDHYAWGDGFWQGIGYWRIMTRKGDLSEL